MLLHNKRLTKFYRRTTTEHSTHLRSSITERIGDGSPIV
ncbi:hypothetical protein SynA1524_02638 [Synechococcus sp. A15-24]|nr:hypothetical protein SynA1524_02638 [Synechococcus sp. A15-24]